MVSGEIASLPPIDSIWDKGREAVPPVYCLLSTILMDISSFDIQLLGDHLLLLLLPLAALGGYLLYKRTNPPASSRLRKTLGIIRTATLCILIVLLTEPILSLTFRETKLPQTVLLIDTSESMGLKDASGDRLETLLSILKGPVVEDLRSRSDMKLFTFANRVDALGTTPFDSIRTDGRGTDIAKALNLQQMEEPTRAIILLSDGGHNLGQDPVKTADRIQVPVYTLGIGSPEEQKDIKIDKISYRDFSYTGKELPIVVTVGGSGYKDLEVPVTVSEDGVLLREKSIKLTGDGMEQTVELKIKPKKPGLHRYTVGLSLLDSEISFENNASEIAVEVLKSKIKILLIAGEPSFDLAFLKRFLQNDESLDLYVLVLKNQRDFYRGGFPKSTGEMAAFDLAILLDVPREALKGERETLLWDFVRSGKGILFVGGHRTLDRDFLQSPLNALLPVVAYASSPSFQEGKFHLEITPAGSNHAVTRFSDDPEENDEIWRDLPPLLGWNNNSGLRPKATALAVHPSLKIPIIAVGEYGLGKTCLISASSLWRFDFMMWGIGVTNAPLQRLYGNAVRWLMAKNSSRRVRVETDRLIYTGGEEVTFSAHVYDEALQPQVGAEVQVEIEGPKSQLIDLPGTFPGTFNQDQDGVYRRVISGLGPGNYQFKATASTPTGTIGEDSGEFTVDRYSLEFQSTRMNKELLEGVAYASGGKFYTRENFDEIKTDLQLKERHKERKAEGRLYRRPYLLILLIALLTIEWSIRRRKGMV